MKNRKKISEDFEVMTASQASKLLGGSVPPNTGEPDPQPPIPEPDKPLKPVPPLPDIKKPDEK